MLAGDDEVQLVAVVAVLPRSDDQSGRHHHGYRRDATQLGPRQAATTRAPEPVHAMQSRPQWVPATRRGRPHGDYT
jgi:hypothetical protein